MPSDKGKYKEKISLNKLSCKLATQFLVKNKFVTPTAEKRMVKANVDDKTIQLIYSLPFKVTKDTSDLSSFNLRLLTIFYQQIQHFLEIHLKKLTNVI